MADSPDTVLTESPRLPAPDPASGAAARPLPGARDRRGACWRGGLFLLVVGVLAGPYLQRLWSVWLHVPEYAHGPLLPAFSALMLWDRRQEFAAVDWRPSWWAVPVVAAGALGFLAANLVGETFTIGLALVLILLGGVLAVGGASLFRLAWFPVAFLLFGVPLPDGILIALLGNPLRDQAAQWSAAILGWLGYAVFLKGTVLQLPRISLEIAYECSGIRGLIAAVPLAAAVAYLFHRSWQERLLLCLVAVPLGLVSNVLRIVAIAVRAYDFTRVPSEAQLHGPTGWVPTLFILPSLYAISEVMRWGGRRLHSGSR